MKRLLLGLLAVVVVAGLVAYALRTTLVVRVMERALERNAASSLLDELPDGLHVVLCGAGSPLPDPERSGPCTAVIAGKRLFVVDVGSGASRNLARLRIPQGRIDAILLTHFHSDHIDGLGELLLQRWVNGTHETPTPVHGPKGVERVVAGFNAAYRLDQGYRVAHHGPETVPPGGFGARAVPFAAPPDGDGVTLIDDGYVKVTAFRVSHDPIDPAVGYRFDYGGRSALISGDTTKSDNLLHFAEGVDLLVHEALAPQLVAIITEAQRNVGRDAIAKVTVDILDYHTTPVEAAEIAQDAGVGFLLFHHIVPPLILSPLEDIFVEGVADVYDGPFRIGRDGTAVSLPSDSDAIEIEQYF